MGAENVTSFHSARNNRKGFGRQERREIIQKMIKLGLISHPSLSVWIFDPMAAIFVQKEESLHKINAAEERIRRRYEDHVENIQRESIRRVTSDE